MLGCAGAPAGLPPQQAAETDAFILDHRDPRSVVEAILYAAQTGDIDVMCNLCDPRLMNDETTEDLCFIMEEDVPRFRKQYGNAAIAGEIELQYGYARVTLALARGRKLYDKREKLKRRTQDDEARRAMDQGRA